MQNLKCKMLNKNTLRVKSQRIRLGIGQYQCFGGLKSNFFRDLLYGIQGDFNEFIQRESQLFTF